MKLTSTFITALLLLLPFALNAQTEPTDTVNWLSSPGVIGTIVLIVIVLVVAIIILMAKLSNVIGNYRHQQIVKKDLAFNEDLIKLDDDEIDDILTKRKAALAYKLKGDELGSGSAAIKDY